MRVAGELGENSRWQTRPEPDPHQLQSCTDGSYFWFEKSVNELRVWLTGWELDNMMTEGLYKHLLFKISSANADTPRQLSHFSCRWAILMRLLCTFSTTKLPVPFLLKTPELCRMAKLMNYCIFFLPAAQRLVGTISARHAQEPRGRGCWPKAMAEAGCPMEADRLSGWAARGRTICHCTFRSWHYTDSKTLFVISFSNFPGEMFLRVPKICC